MYNILVKDWHNLKFFHCKTNNSKAAERLIRLNKKVEEFTFINNFMNK